VSGCPPPSFKHGTSNRARDSSYHFACSVPNEEHHRAVAAAIYIPLSDWKWHQEDPTIHGPGPLNLRPLNISLSYAGRTHRLVNTVQLLLTIHFHHQLFIQLWTWLHSRRVSHEKRDRDVNPWVTNKWKIHHWNTKIYAEHYNDDMLHEKTCCYTLYVMLCFVINVILWNA